MASPATGTCGTHREAGDGPSVTELLGCEEPVTQTTPFAVSVELP